jgi:dicarboxylate transporter 10
MIVARPTTTSTSTATTATTVTAVAAVSRIPSTIVGNNKKSLSTTKKVYKSPFWFGGAASCLATFVSHPFDLTKVRLQTLRVENNTFWSEFKLLSPTRMVKTMWTISSTEGIPALYNGLSASLLRQGTYSTIRFGLYDYFKWQVAGDQSNVSYNKGGWR